MGAEQLPQFAVSRGQNPVPDLLGPWPSFTNSLQQTPFTNFLQLPPLFRKKFWLADARSVAYLDLCAREYRKPRDVSFSALDLCVKFRKEDPIVPDGPLFKIFNRVTCPLTLLYKHANSATFYQDINRIMLGKLTVNFETETLRLYVKLLKLYSRYIKESLFPVRYLLSDKTIKLKLLYREVEQLVFHDRQMSGPAKELKNLLFENNCIDSKLIAEFLRTVCTSSCTRVSIFLGNNIRKTEYFLNHLKNRNCDMGAWMQECFCDDTFQSDVREKPQHLLMFLNYGYKIIFKASTHLRYMKSLFHCMKMLSFFCGSYKDEELLQRSNHQHLQRESLILELFETFCIDPMYSSRIFGVHLESLRICWRSIPDAFVTCTELKCVVLRLLGDENNARVEDACNRFQDYCNSQPKSDDIFQPRNNNVLQPRSLSHYSRCVLREMLGRNSQLPEGIALLNLRDDLQSYLRLEC